jgi:hypothetical protein
MSVAGGKVGNGAEKGANVEPEATSDELDGILHERGDRWKLDTLIPNSDRLLVGPQVERTSKLRVGTKPVLVTGTLNSERASHRPIYSRAESSLDIQRRLRQRYCGDEPLPGDILL